MYYRFYSLLIVLSSLFFSVSCIDTDYLPCVKPSGKTMEESRAVDGFNSINLALHANVYITEGTESTITIVATENILEQISTTNRSNILYIDNTRCLRTRTDDIKIFITMPEIESIKMFGSGNIYVETPFKGEKTNLEISGSGNISFPKAEYTNIKSSISGSGNIHLSGNTADHRVQISGSGKVNAFEMLAEKTDVRISGSGSVQINVSDFLDARISGSGKVNYKGNPGTNIRISGSGSVNHIL